jgi:hypothetical protein
VSAPAATPAVGIGAGAALRAALGDLARWPAATLLALATATVGTLALRAGWLRALQFVDAAGDRGAFSAVLFARAVVVLLAGGAVAGLLADVGCAIALTAYAGAPPPRGRSGALGLPLRRGLERAPAMISVRAVEILVYGTLATGELLLLGHGLPTAAAATPARLAAVTTLALAPAMTLALYLFAAARVAQTLIARGFGPGAALAHGLDVALRRFGALARLGLTALVWTLPLWLAAFFLPSPLAAALVTLALLWSYAALVRVVGADGRLLIG